MIPTWAVIPSAGRPEVHDCVRSLRDQVDGIVIVTNGGYRATDIEGVCTAPYDDPRPNISKWWNTGLDAVGARCHGPRNIIVLNDDVIMGSGAVERLADGLRLSRASLSFPGAHPVWLGPESPERITGWCFMLAGEQGMRADERFEWWYGDNDLDWRARQLGGTVTVPAVHHIHTDPNGYTNRVPALAQQTAHDRQTFIDLWGRLPH